MASMDQIDQDVAIFRWFGVVADDVVEGRLPAEDSFFSFLHAVALAVLERDSRAAETAVGLIAALEDGVPDDRMWDGWRGRLRSAHMLVWILTRSLGERQFRETRTRCFAGMGEAKPTPGLAPGTLHDE
jgi:hypothetical protein